MCPSVRVTPGLTDRNQQQRVHSEHERLRLSSELASTKTSLSNATRDAIKYQVSLQGAAFRWSCWV